MPRPSIDLEPYRQEISILRACDHSITDIISLLATEYDLSISRRTLYRALRLWNIHIQARTIVTDALRSRIQQLFFDECLKDKYILQRLYDEGYIITPTGLRQIRKDLGLRRRQDPVQIQQAIHQARIFFTDTTQLPSILRDYGRGYLYTYMRQQHHIISRDALYSVYREIAPENIIERYGKARYKRRDFAVPGPDWIWSVDGYDKLKPWGFEIYAAIDAYSRYITWFYCGFSASTAWNVAAQYIDVLAQRGMMPLKIRSDHGGETALMCGLHYYLSMERKVKIGPELVPITFRDCWSFGRSVHNVRIESWWHRLYQGQAGKWRVSYYYLFLY